MNTTQIQRELINRGYNLGRWGADGDWGRMSISAWQQWQRDTNLSPIVDLPTDKLAALLLKTPGGKVGVLASTPWVDNLLKRKGLHEKRDLAELRAYLKSDGRTLGDPSKYPWCGDCVETPLALTLPNEPLPSNPYLARNWRKFGVPTPPRFGAVGVYWRGSKTGTQGHVAYVVGKGSGVLYLLGGNQSDQISVVPKANSYLLECRWPKTVPLPRTIYLPTMTGGKLSINEA